MSIRWRDRIEHLYRVASARPGAIPLGGGFPAPHLFPSDALADASSRVLHRLGQQVLQYDWPEGREDLRGWIAERLRRRGADVAPEDVLVTSGAQQALAITAELLLEPGAAVGMDAATYPGAIEIFAGRCARPSAHRDGWAEVFYRMPELANPTGTIMGAAERERLLARADGRAVVIEDEAYAELRFDGPPGTPMLASARERVWFIGSFSKTLSPGLRVGWLVPPRARLAEAAELKKLQDIQSNGLTQAALMDFLAHDDFDARLEKARRYYARQAERLLDACGRHLPDWQCAAPAGGFSLWLEAPMAGNGIDFLAEAVHHGVTFDPGRLFQPSARAGKLAMRVCFSGVRAKDLDEGARRLGRAWRAYVRSVGRSAR